MSDLAKWDGFYGIVGSAAGALIGLQFVVLALIAERPPVRAAEAGAAFGTPTIVHFSVALLLSAGLRAPWPSILAPAILCGAVGWSGIVYAAIVARRLRRQSAYKPEFEDWLFHFMLPFIAYALLAVALFVTERHTREAFFGVGAATLMLLFIGIHNAWDSVAYHVLVTRAADRDRS